MQRYIIRRLILLIPTLLGVSIIVFAGVRFLPGDVIDQMLGESGGANPELRQQLAESYSLSGSMPEQYVEWMSDIVRGDLGTSILSGRPVVQDLKTRLAVTAELGMLALVVTVIIALPVGVISAIRQNTLIDLLARSLSIGLLAIPSFWLALMVITYGFVWFHWTPPLSYENLWDKPLTNLMIMWVPAVILGAIFAGQVMRFTRSTMLEVLRQDYVRTAWAKGLGERVIVLRHCLRNALIPVVTVIGTQLAVLVGGTVVLEYIFTLPGMGGYLLVALQQRDYPIVQAIVLIAALWVVAVNLIVDLSYTFLDPRIRYT